MITLVIAKNVTYFWNHINDRFQDFEIMRINKAQCQVILMTGDELRYVSSKRSFRGYHGVNVVMWSVPDWFDYTAEQEAKLAMMK